MKITRGLQTSKRREWMIADAVKEYRVECAWNIGSMRMEWEVYVKVSPPQVQTHWRRIKGLWLIHAVREYENTLAHLST